MQEVLTDRKSVKLYKVRRETVAPKNMKWKLNHQNVLFLMLKFKD